MKGSKAWMDGLEGWAESGVGMLVSFLAQRFIAHTASTQLHTDQGGALSHTYAAKHTHKPTPKNILLLLELSQYQGSRDVDVFA